MDEWRVTVRTEGRYEVWLCSSFHADSSCLILQGARRLDDGGETLGQVGYSLHQSLMWTASRNED